MMMKRFKEAVNSKSMKIRFSATLVMNVLKIVFSFAAGLLIARGLGPAGYGNFTFLMGSFVSINVLLDMGTSNAFYTFIAQKKQSNKFYLYYWAWLVVQFVVMVALITLIFPSWLKGKIWLGQPNEMILLAFLASFSMTKIWETAAHMGESIRETVLVQMCRILAGIVYLILIFVMLKTNWLTLAHLYISITGIYVLFTALLAGKLRESLVVNKDFKFADMLNDFKVYCAPLILCGIVGFGHTFADIWLLQKYGGAVQQGYYSVGLRFSAVCLIATTAMLKVFWKEVAEAKEKGDKDRLNRLYEKISRALCFVGAVGACFLVPFSKEILVKFLGPNYEAGWLCLAIMFLFPIHQSLGQINGTYSFATSQTKLYSNMAIFGNLLSIPITYFVLASPASRIPGLDLGSVGLALKMVVLQMILVNIFGYFICRVSGWRFRFVYQFFIVGFLLVVAFFSKWVLWGDIGFLELNMSSAVKLFFYPVMYLSFAGSLVIFSPQLAGLDKKQLYRKIFNVFYGKKEV